MHYKNKSHSPRLRRNLLASAIMATSLPAAHAVEVNTGNEDWTVRFDNTVKYNYGVRTESADKRMLATPNNNDGDYNFRKSGTNITNRIDLLTEMDVIYQGNMGFRVSAASWYDKAYDRAACGSPARTDLCGVWQVTAIPTATPQTAHGLRREAKLLLQSALRTSTRN